MTLRSSLVLFAALASALGTLGRGARKRLRAPSATTSPTGFASLNGGTTGGKGGRIVTARSHAELVALANATEPLVIRTIVGVGAGAKIVGGGFVGIANHSNIILGNLQISDTYIPEDYNGRSEDWDGLQVDTGTNIWIDHVTFARMADGLLDLRKDTDYVTVSNCLFSSHNKAFGIGWTPNVVSKMTVNDDFFHSTNQCNPSADNLLVCHMYNNYFLNVTSYGN
ncbi:Pectate trisaccharide-lyase [Colletotrichum trifolii]|uniref:Pectate trisaccharide-lyase n=1 Tax=Colletotrichum trifolii TaxID=5466 RepID=A0A4R8RPI7_COLTR|nr:Pectate trisaccharide-lyase [Colletotrichum trifolii]